MCSSDLTPKVEGLVMAKYRKRMSRKRSKKLFSRTASKTHRFNVNSAMPMRGGIRL